jgi:hypothetical protein
MSSQMLELAKGMLESVGSQFQVSTGVNYLIRKQDISRKNAQSLYEELVQAQLLTLSNGKDIDLIYDYNSTVNLEKSLHPHSSTMNASVAKIYNMDHIPLSLKNTFPYDCSRLVYNGYLVAKYQQNGNLILSHITEDRAHEVPATHPSPIVVWTNYKSLVFSLHSGGILQALDVESRQTHSYPSISQQLANSSVALLADDAKIVALSPPYLIVWDRSVAKGHPKEFTLETVNWDIPLLPDYCNLLPDDMLLLVFESGSSASTVWNLANWREGQVELVCKSGGVGECEQVTCALGYKNTVALGTVGESVYLGLWNVPNSTPLAVFPKNVSENGNACVSSLFIDDWFIVVGDSSGNVTLYNRTTGQKLYVLSSGIGIRDSQNSGVAKVVRVGRWLFAGHCTCPPQLAVYDLYSSRSHPTQLYTHSNSTEPFSSMDFRVHPGAVTVILDNDKADNGKPPTVAVWGPKLDTLELYLKNPMVAQSHPILPALIYGYRRVVDSLSSVQMSEDSLECLKLLELTKTTLDFVIKLEVRYCFCFNTC